MTTTAPAFAASGTSAQLATVAALGTEGAAFHPDAIEAATDDFYEFRDYNRATTFDILDDIDNVASPRAMARAWWHLIFANGLSDDSDERLRKILKRGDGAIDRRSIDVKLNFWAGKGGSDLGMGSMAGYGETRAGRHIVYAVMGARMRNEDADWVILEDTLTWVFDTLDAP